MTEPKKVNSRQERGGMWLHGTTARLADEVQRLLLQPGAEHPDPYVHLRELLQDLARHLTERDLKPNELHSVWCGGERAFLDLLRTFQQERLKTLEQVTSPPPALMA